ncbi:MAG: peroxidase family protein [Pseudomonadota bacterium]
MKTDLPPRYLHAAGSYFRLFPVAPCNYQRSQLQQVVDAINNKVITIADPSTTPAGYTYLGQFIDHEITHMQHLTELPTAGPLAVEALVQRRNCAFDLDSIYGNGLDDELVPYTSDGCFYSEFMQAGRLYDLPRGAGKQGWEARIAEYHNDENFIVAQMQVLFMNAHNQLMQQYRTDISDVASRFRHVRAELALWLQALIVHDFLPRFIDPQVWAFFFGPYAPADAGAPHLLQQASSANAGVPLEFAGAAYRFGHSLVRGSYALNDEYLLPVSLRNLFGLTGKGGLRNPETGAAGADLQPYTIDWKYFFPMSYAYHANTLTLKPKIADQLRDLINEMPGHQDLLLRNLLRGQELGLPSAQAVCDWLQTDMPEYCRQLHFAPLSGEQIASHDLGPVLRQADLAEQTPLWLYILMEPAFNASNHTRLGKLGSLILAETFRMLMRCSTPSLLDYSNDFHEPTNAAEDLRKRYPVAGSMLFPLARRQAVPPTVSFIQLFSKGS